MESPLFPQVDKDTGRPYVSPSQIQKLMACPAKWRYHYLDGLKEPASPEMLTGTVVHAALERILRGEGGPEEAFLAAAAASEAEATRLGLDKDAWANLQVESHRLMVAGLEWWMDSGLKAINVERKVVRAAVVDGVPVDVMGYIDVLAERPDGSRVVLDWKTAARAPPRLADNSFQQDRGHSLQLLIYADALLALGERCDEIVTVKLTKAKQSQACPAALMVTPGMLDFSRRITETAVRKILRQEFEPNPFGAGFLCGEKTCAYWSICPSSPKSLGVGEV